MPKLEIVKYPDSRLKEVAKEVTVFDQKLHSLLANMAETMYAARGIGLAAPQVAAQVRAVVIDIRDEPEEPSQLIELVNPTILQSEGRTSSEEGCLSIPGYRDTVPRKKSLKVTAQDRHGNSFEFKAQGLLAICIQHEIDHLDGILFVDRLSRLKRELFKRWVSRQNDGDEDDD